MSTLDALKAIDARMFRYSEDQKQDFPPGPWDFEFNGARLALATDGHMLVGVRRDLIAEELPAAPPKVAALARKWLLADMSYPVVVPVSALRSFAGVPDPERPVVCGDCKGTGVVRCDHCRGSRVMECECECGDTHDAQCDECDGTGKMDCDCRPSDRDAPGGFFGAVVDRNKLASIIAAVPEGDVSVSTENISGDKSGWLLRSAGADPSWFAVLIAMLPREKVEAHFQYPRYRRRTQQLARLERPK